MPNTRLTNTLISNLEADPAKHVLHRDTEVPGLALRVTKAGKKSFVLNYSINGRERRMTIGGFPTWTVQAARDEAKKLRRNIDTGQDPLEEKQQRAAAPTVQALWEDYRSNHLPNLSTRNIADQERMWKKHILPKLGRMKLVDLTSRHVDQLHGSVSQSAPVVANRMVASLRKALNMAKRHRWIDTNVAEGVRKNPEHPRERYLTPEETGRLVDALARRANQSAANALLLLLLTGARRNEVFGASWNEFDLSKGDWKKPAGRVKTRRNTTVPLSPPALDLLQKMKAASNSPYLFPSKTGAPIQDINVPWNWLIEEAKLSDFRIHDLRHSFASFLVSDGTPLEQIGRLLGHTQAQTTMRYAHLTDDPLRKAVAGIGNMLTEKARIR